MKTHALPPLPLRGWLALAVACVGFTPARAAAPDAAQMDRGREIYGTSCTVCHLDNGAGMPFIGVPPLAGSDFLQADRARAIRISLYGLAGDITVNGEKYSGMMSGQRHYRGARTMPSAEIADALTYIMNSWGNTLGAVTAAEVDAIRQADAALLAPRPAPAARNSRTAAVPTTPAQQVAFLTRCADCHRSQGGGMEPSMPPLADSDFLRADPERAIRIIVGGIGGPITVNGRTYEADMPLMALPDQQVADALNYALNSWGNSYGTVTAADVARVRRAP